MKKFCFFILILFFTKTTFAVEFQGKFIQGHFIIGKTESGTKVLIDKRKSELLMMDFLHLVSVEIENMIL